jgi:hypothetical protein
LVIYAVGLLLSNFSYIRRTGDLSGLPLLRFPIIVIIVLGLWVGVGLARWVSLLVAGYLAAAGWLSLIASLPIRFYAHPPYPKWLAIGLLLIPPIAASLAFLALTHLARESP